MVREASEQLIAVVRLRKDKSWVLPKGKLKPGEDALACARREVMEETGLDARRHALTDWRLENEYEIFEEWRWRYAPGVTRNTEHVFGLMLPAPVEVRISPREHLAQAWLPWWEAAERCFSWSNAAAIRTLPEKDV